MTHELQTIEFHNEEIFLVENDGEPYVPVKPIVENMGLAWPPQYTKLMAKKERWSIMIIVIVAADGKQRVILGAIPGLIPSQIYGKEGGVFVCGIFSCPSVLVG